MQFEIIAQARTLQGSGASRRLRRAGKVPAIIYGGEAAPQAIEVDHNDLLLNLRKEAFHASILNIVVEGKKQQVLLRDTQRHAYKPLILHVDFQRVDATHEVHIKVPLHFKGEELSDAVKLEHCLVSHILNEIEVSCLPANLPEFIEVDLSTVTKGQTIHLSNITLPKGVTAVSHGAEDPVLVTVTPPKGGTEAEGSEKAGKPAETAPAADSKKPA